MADERKSDVVEPPKPPAATSIPNDTFPLSQATVDFLLARALHWTACRGLMSSTAAGSPLLKHVPFALTPSKFPRKAFELAQRLMQPYGKLVAAISEDKAWLRRVVHNAATADEFSAHMLRIFDTVEKEGVKQPLSLGLLRSDYMLNSQTRRAGSLLQVELNTMSSSFGPLAAKVGQLHEYILSRNLVTAPGLADFVGVKDTSTPLAAVSELEGRQRLPPNHAREELAAGLAHAHKLNTFKTPTSVVMFLVQSSETNIVDQSELELCLWDKHRIPVVRATLLDIAKYGVLDKTTKNLKLTHVAGTPTVSVVYFRAGYTPRDYPSQTEWDARLTIERSSAIKCPNITFHLIGMKKVQQELAMPGAVERFLSPADSALVRSSFAGLWNLDVSTSSDGGQDVAEAIVKASKNPESYVLKPQREGGGNNFYGKHVRTKLAELHDEERAAYILMERIFPAEQDAILVRDGKAVCGRCVLELGIFGVILNNGATVLRNTHAGHLVRAKLVGVDEGGVASGYAVVSSPYLTDPSDTV